jgi:hypothetical protein
MARQELAVGWRVGSWQERWLLAAELAVGSPMLAVPCRQSHVGSGPPTISQKKVQGMRPRRL